MCLYISTITSLSMKRGLINLKTLQVILKQENEVKKEMLFDEVIQQDGIEPEGRPIKQNVPPLEGGRGKRRDCTIYY